jgi:hypothetical protein
MDPTTTESPRISKGALFRSIDYTPHPGQLLVHRSKAPRRVLACGVRWGKTTCGVGEAIAAMLQPRESSLGWVVAPSYDLADKTFRQVSDSFQTHFRQRIQILDMRGERLVVHNLGGGISELRAKSADQPVGLLGEGLDWMIVDEAARLRADVWECYLSQRLVDRKGWVLFLSTPAGPGWFHQLYRRGIRNRDPHTESWSSPSWLNPHIDKDLVEAERARLPASVFAEQYGGEFQGVEEEPCEVCFPPSPKVKRIFIVRNKEQLVRCPACNHPVDEQGRDMVPAGAKYIKIIKLVLDKGDRDHGWPPEHATSTEIPAVPASSALDHEDDEEME